MNTRIPKQFELPTAFLSPNGAEYIPPATHREAEAAARRDERPGALILAQQRLGSYVGALYISRLTSAEGMTSDDIRFGSDIVSAAALGSARLSYRQANPTMRRHLALPMLVDPETDERMTSDSRVMEATRRLQRTALLSSAVHEEFRTTGKVRPKIAQGFARTAGETALWVALLPHPEIGYDQSAARVQRDVRDVGMEALETTRKLGEIVGANISYAMLGGPTTNLTAHIERHSPHGAHRAFEFARNITAQLVGPNIAG